MKILLVSLICVGSVILGGCRESGNYRVYKRPNSREIIMGYHFGDGAVLGLSNPTVTAAGANERHVVFQVNSASYYYIVRESAGEGTTYGPLDEKAYGEVSQQYSLPPFDWHLPRTIDHGSEQEKISR